MAVITIDPVTYSGTWHYSTTTVELRIYADKTFTSSTGVIVQSGSPGYGFYTTFTCSVAGTSITINSGSLHSTRDGRDYNSARYSAYFFNTTTGAQIQVYDGFDNFQLSEVDTAPAWSDILAFNRAGVPLVPDNVTYSRTEILYLIANGMGTMTGTLGITQGGTGATTASAARTNLGTAASGANSDITSLTGLTTPLSVAQGGTAGTTASAARTNLGAAASGVNTDITGLQGLNVQDAIMVNPYGASAGNTGEIRLLELAANGTNYIGFKAPDTTTANFIIALPNNSPSSGQVLTAGTTASFGGATVIPTSWVTPSGMGSGYSQMQEEGANLTQRSTLNFIGGSLTAVDNAGATRTDVTLSQSPAGATSVVGTTRLVSTGTGLSGGGDLSADRTLILANTAVTPGSYTNANITVDAQGRLTSAANGSAAGSAYATIQEEGSGLTQRTVLNFIGGAITATDNAGATRTDVTLSISPAGNTTVVGVGRTITNGTGITGGGDLSADRTLSVVADTTIQKVELAKAGTLVGTGRKRINFIDGSGASVTVADNAGTNSYDVTVASTGSGGGTVTGTGTTNSIAKWTSSTAIGNASITDNGAAITLSLPTSIATTLSVSNQITSTYTGGAAPFIVASTNPVSNLTLAADSQLPTISSAGKVSNSATTATSANTGSTIVSRDGSGNFSAGTITASLTGSSTTFTGSLTGDVTSTGMATTYSATVPATKGGTGLSSYTIGNLLVAATSTTLSQITPNNTTTAKMLVQTGNGTTVTDTSWQTMTNGMMGSLYIDSQGPLATVSNTTTETSVYSFVVPANTITAQQGLFIKLLFVVSTPLGSLTWFVRPKINGSQVGLVQDTDGVCTSRIREVEWFIQNLSTATSQQNYVKMSASRTDNAATGVSGTIDTISNFISAVDFTVPVTLSITIQMSTASTTTSFTVQSIRTLRQN